MASWQLPLEYSNWDKTEVRPRLVGEDLVKPHADGCNEQGG